MKKYLYCIPLVLYISQGFGVPPHDVVAAKKALFLHHESGDFDKECDAIIDAAITYLQANEQTFDSSKTIIFDIDDTLLTHFGYVYKNDFCTRCNDVTFSAWVHQAVAPIIPAVKRLYDYCVEHSYHIVLLSNRPAGWYEATVQNLARNGCTIFDRMLLKADDASHIPSSVHKLSHRQALTEQGYTIVACVGDQEGDFEGGYTGYCIKIPNYFYRA